MMNAYTDVNIGFEYRYKKHISTFLQLNNLTNNNYQRWAAYTNYRFNMMAGFTFTF
jgi:outer membrane receptor protein involved in Fe transport